MQLTEARRVPTNAQWVPEKAAAAMLSVHRSTLARLVARGEIKKAKFGHAARYSVADLEAFMERCVIDPSAGR